MAGAGPRARDLAGRDAEGGRGSTRTAAGGWLVAVVLVLAAAMGTAAAPPGPAAAAVTPLCERQECNCTELGRRIVAHCRLAASQILELGPGALPLWLLELHVQGGEELRLEAGAFSALHELRLVNTSDTQRLVARRHAFLNVSSQHVRVNVAECASAVLESHAFHSPTCPASLDVRRCGHVVVQSEAFAWLLRAQLKGVARLELAPKAFALAQSDGRRHGPSTAVLLEETMLAELPRFAFPSRAAEVRLVDAHVRVVRRDAFYALQLITVAFDNSSLQTVEAGAFSERTLVHTLSLTDTQVGVLAAGAVQSAVNNLTLVRTKVEKVESGAVNITVAKVTMAHCDLGSVEERGFAFSNWDSMLVRDNTFRVLHADGVSAPFQRVTGVSSYEFRFRDNTVAELRARGLASVSAVAARAMADVELRAEVGATSLLEPCRCDLPDRLGGDELLLVATTCAVDAGLARCMGLPTGRASAANYSSRVCNDRERVLVCEAAPGGPLPPPSAAAETPDRGREVLALIFAAVVLGSLAVLAGSATLWLRRKGYCRTGRWAPPASATSCLAQLARVWAARRHAAAATPANNAPGPHPQYSELRGRDGAAGDAADEEAGAEGGAAEAEDKWTQTLPEELTQELLQALREKLDDPENYSEARDMIEHLYDLIKVEESCNNNNRAEGSLPDLADQDSLYEAIRPRVRPARDTCSVGTRAPSPDALAPSSPGRRRPPLCEYREPQDLTQHLYAEVPGRPGDANPVPGPSTSAPRSPRPLSFLRALGESLQSVLPSAARPGPSSSSSPPPPPPRPTTSLLCEYAEPTDAAEHVYSEVSMANRPLPDAPRDSPARPGPLL